MTQYRVHTIEIDADGNLRPRPSISHPSLAQLVRYARLFGWVPGAVSATGLTIVETRFVSEEV